MLAAFLPSRKVTGWAFFLSLSLLTCACHRNDTPAVAAVVAGPLQPTRPSPEDFVVAKNAMRLSEVAFKLRGGTPKDELLAEVLRRKVVTSMVSATELELAAFGAGSRLLAALKDPINLLTEKQEQAYGELAQAKQNQPALKVANARPVAISPVQAAQAEELRRKQDLDRYSRPIKQDAAVARAKSADTIRAAREAESQSNRRQGVR